MGAQTRTVVVLTKHCQGWGDSSSSGRHSTFRGFDQYYHCRQKQSVVKRGAYRVKKVCDRAACANSDNESCAGNPPVEASWLEKQGERKIAQGSYPCPLQFQWHETTG